MTPLERLTNLLIMAVVDGKFTDQEIHFVLQRAARWGIPEATFNETLNRVCRGEASLQVPSNPHERDDVLRDLIRMMAADGRLSEREERLFAVIAAKLNIDRSYLDKLIDSVVGKPDKPSS